MIPIKSHYTLLILLTSLLLVRCATVSAPTGGPKDNASPVVIESSIDNGSTNFEGKSIIITFNEYVKVDNPKLNVYSSPPLGNNVSYVTKKNKLFIIFKEALDENTTYHLNFGNSIQDINERNPLNNYQFVFATGDEIDSLSYQGRLSAINQTEITENTLIGLYKSDEDSAFLKEPPYYFTFVSDNGNFVLDYLKAGEYSVYALTDLNNNYYYDLPNESIGFLDSAIVLSENLFLADIPLFVPEEVDIRVKSFTNKISDYKIEFEFSRSIPRSDSLSVQIIADSTEVTSKKKLSDDRQKITYWLDKTLADKKTAITILKLNDELIDTFQHSISQLKIPELTAELSSLKMTQNDSIIVTLSNPMDTPCLNIVLIDSLKADTSHLDVRKVTDFQIVALSSHVVKPNVVYTLLTAVSCLGDIYGQKIVLPAKKFEIEEKEERGTLILQFDGVDSLLDYNLDLQNDQKKSIKSQLINSENTNWTIGNLIPGTYYLQIFEDENKNGVWNSGSFIPRKLPEKIYTYPKEFILRPNWELEESINLNTP